MDEKIFSQNIRSIRNNQGLTLEEVAQRTGYTKGLLSKIENNKVSPPVSTLVKIAKALGVSLSDFFSESDMQQIKVRQKKERIIFMSDYYPDGQVIETLITGFHKQKMEPLIISIEDSRNFITKLYNHPGQEFIYILEGTMKYVYGDNEYVVSEGDSLYFNAEILHGPSPLPDQKVKYLSVLCP